MKNGWFGKNWGAPLCYEDEQVAAPIGQACKWCNEKIKEGDNGFIQVDSSVFHLECMLRSVLGGVNHIRKTCSCYGGTDEPDPPHLTLHEAAKMAMAEWERKNN